MEKENERVLAYSKARIISRDDLDEVSGGMSWSKSGTLVPSAAGGAGADVQIDVSLDM